MRAKRGVPLIKSQLARTQLNLEALCGAHLVTLPDRLWGGAKSTYQVHRVLVRSGRLPSLLSGELSTYKTAMARFWPWLSGQNPLSCSLFARERIVEGWVNCWVTPCTRTWKRSWAFTLHSTPSNPNLNPTPRTPHPKPETPTSTKNEKTNPTPQTQDPRPQVLNPKPQLPNLDPQTATPKPRTANPKPRTANPKPRTANP